MVIENDSRQSSLDNRSRHETPNTRSAPGHDSKRSDYRERRLQEPLHRAIELHDGYWFGAPHCELDTVAEFTQRQQQTSLV